MKQSPTLGAHTHAHGHPYPWVLGGHGCDAIVHGWTWVAVDGYGMGMGTNSKKNVGIWYELICDWALNQMLFQRIYVHAGPQA